MLDGFVARLTKSVSEFGKELDSLCDIVSFGIAPAVLVAGRLAPHVLQRCVFAHRSDERGHSLMLAQMQAEPLLQLNLRLGEGSGAALAWPLLESACRVLAEMASFESAGVATQTVG